MSGHVKESWSEEISPYLARLAEALDGYSRSSEPITIRFQGNELTLTTREKKLVLASQQTGGVALPPRLELVKFGIGLQAKILCDLRILETSKTPNDIKDALEALKSDGVIGSRIAYEMRTEINELAAASRMDESMKIADNRRALRAAVELANSITEADPKSFLLGDKEASTELTKKRRLKVQQKEKISESEKEKIRASRIEQATAAALEDAAQQKFTVRELSQDDKQALARNYRVKKKIAIVLVVVFILVSGAVTALMTWQKSLPTFAAADFDDIPGLDAVIVRSPEILIVVNPEVWTSLTTLEKKEAVRRIAATVGPAGYHLAEFRTLQTPGLAFWKRNGTIEIKE